MAAGNMSTPLKHVRGLGPAKSGTVRAVGPICRTRDKSEVS